MDPDFDRASRGSLPIFDNATATTLPPSVISQNATQLAIDSLGELLRIVIHDLANPLQSITMQLELLEDGHEGTPRLQTRVDSMLDTAEEFSALLGSLSAFFHRPSSGSSVCCVRESVQRLNGLLEDRLAHRGIRWEVDTALLPIVTQPCSELELVLLHILILAGYARRDAQDASLLLRTTFAVPTPDTGGGSKIRVHCTLTGSSCGTQPVILPSNHEELNRIAQRLSPGACIHAFPDGSLQLDLQLPTKETAPHAPSA